MRQPVVILDFPGRPRQRFERPARVLEARTVDEVRPVLREAERAAAAGARVAGFVAYEAAPAFDPAMVARAHEGPAPLAWFGLFEDAADAGMPADTGMPLLDWRPDVHRAAYDAAIRTIRDAIAAGDVYQVNHTIRFHAPCAVEPRMLYDALVAQQHGRWHALIDAGDWAIVSASPELFVDVRDGVITTRPMKGTMRRGRWPAEDRAQALRLAASAKDRAENLMITDLLRNDVGRVAEFGTVEVASMFDVERYPTVHQMTSTVRARLRDGSTIDDVFTAMFPCGSVTGAPKIAAMKLIRELETSPRGPYCGAVGELRPDGSATFNVAIRTLVIDRAARSAVYGAGGGITWDSSADAEYDEAIAKAGLLHEHTPAFDLLETMRLDEGVVSRLALHLDRLDASADYWGFDARVRAAAEDAIERERTAAPRGTWRLRLTVTREGVARVERTEIDGPVGTGAGAAGGAPDPLVVAIAAEPVSSADRMLQHKTTHRAMYDRARATHPEAFDVLLRNERGEVTEFTFGNVVIELDGEFVTPPLDSGLLGGTFREELLRAGRVRERVVMLADLQRATGVWHINSVREWTPVALPALSATSHP